MSRWLAISMSLVLGMLAASMAGCNNNSGRGLLGSTRVSPPPTNSYGTPQQYYGTPTGSPASGTIPTGSTSGQNVDLVAHEEAVGTGVSESSESGLRLGGMRVNDATVLAPVGGTSSNYTDVSQLPPARGLDFIRPTRTDNTTNTVTSTANTESSGGWKVR